MGNTADILRRAFEKQAPTLLKKQLEEQIRKLGEKVEVKLVNGKLSLYGEEDAVLRVGKKLGGK